MISYKHGVRVRRRTLALQVLENAALQTRDELGYPQEVHITSINDGSHSRNPPSRHYSDEAIDIRTKGPAKNDMGSRTRKLAFRKRMEELAGAKFRVLYEKDGQPSEHIHAQVRKGHVYP